MFLVFQTAFLVLGRPFQRCPHICNDFAHCGVLHTLFDCGVYVVEGKNSGTH